MAQTKNCQIAVTKTIEVKQTVTADNNATVVI